MKYIEQLCFNFAVCHRKPLRPIVTQISKLRVLLAQHPAIWPLLLNFRDAAYKSVRGVRKMSLLHLKR